MHNYEFFDRSSLFKAESRADNLEEGKCEAKHVVGQEVGQKRYRNIHAVNFCLKKT